MHRLTHCKGYFHSNLNPASQYLQVSVGKNHVCVVSADSMVFTWGDNSKGQLGHGDLVSRDEPTHIEGVKGKNVVT